MRNLPAAICRQWVVLLASLMLISLAHAEPEIAGSSLRYCRSPRLVDHSWAYLAYHIRNPDPVPATVRIVLTAERGGTTVFEKVLRIEGNAFIRGRELVTSAPTENYELNLYVGDRRVQRDSIFARFGAPRGRFQILVVNDGDSFEGMGTLDPAKGAIVRAEVTWAGARDCPHHWAGYGDARAVVMAEPKFHLMTAMQFSALLDFVQRGGTLIFINPAGIMEAANTPLRELLPVDPLRIRRIEELPPLDDWGKQFHDQMRMTDERVPLIVPEGFPFLESVAVGDGVTALELNGIPVCRWRRWGLGSVGIFATDPCTKAMRRSECTVPAWNHLLSWTTAPYGLYYPENGTQLPYLLAILTGFRIPSVGAIQKVLAIYLILLLGVLGVGFRYRRHATAWVAAAALGVCFTGAIFFAAFRQNSQRPPRMATVVDVAATGPERRSGHAILSMFSKTDCRPTLKGNDVTALVRALPPLPTVQGRGQQVSLPAPLIVQRTFPEEMATAPNINIQALKPRDLAVLYTLPAQPLPNLPTLTLSAGAMTMEPWNVPDWLPKRDVSVFIICRNGVIHGAVRDGQCVAVPNQGGMLRLDTFSSALEALFTDELLPLPALAMLYPWEHKNGKVPMELGDFDQAGFALELIPLTIQVQPGNVTVPPTLIKVESASRSSALMGRTGPWQGNLLRNPVSYLAFKAIFPPMLADMDLTELRIELDAINPGENLLFDVAVAAPSEFIGPPDAGCWQQATQASERQQTLHVFRNLNAHPPLSRQSGHCGVLLSIRQKNLVDDVGESQRVNAWKVNAIRVTALGAISDSGPRRF